MPDLASLGIQVDSRDVKKATVEFDNFVRGATKAEKQADGLEKSTKKLSKAAKETKEEFASLKNAVSAIGTALAVRQFYMIEKSIVMARVEADRLKSSMTAVFGDGQVAAQMEYLRGVTDRLGLSFISTSAEFSKFAAAAKGTALEGQQTREIFEAVAIAGTKLGLSADQQAGALNALQQMISKGNVQAEELRGQLGERIPGAFQAAAKAMGVTTAELGKMLEDGEVLASDLLPKLAKILKEEYGGEGGAVMTAQAQINRLTTSWDLFKQSVADTGAADAGLGVLSFLTQSLKDATQAMEKARSLGWGGIGQAAAGIGGFLYGHETPAEEQARLGKQINWLKKELKSVTGTGQEIYKQSIARELDAAQARFTALSRMQKIALPTKDQLKKQIEADKKLLEDELKPKDQKGKDKKAKYDNIPLTVMQSAVIDAAEIYEQTRTPLEKLNAAYAELNRLQSMGAFGDDNEIYTRAIKRVQEEYDNATKAVEAWDDSMVKAVETTSTVDTALINSFESAADAIADFAMGGKASVSDMVNSMIRDFIKLELRMQMMSMYKSVGGFGGIMASLFGVGVDTSFTTGLGSAATSGAMDYAAMSFDGGGFTGAGNRTGGVDGKGGFPAILHPNETVIDHTKGQTGGVNVSITINSDGTGRQESSDGNQAMQLGRSIEASVMSVIMREKRPGGMLA